MVYEVILYIAIVQALFSGVLILIKKSINPGGTFLALNLFFIAFEMINTLLHVHKLPAINHLALMFFNMPFLYLYTRNIIRNRKSKKDIFHLIIPSVGCIILLLFTNWDFNRMETFSNNDPQFLFRHIISACYTLVVVSYLFLSFREISRYQNSIIDFHSNISSKVTINWLKTIVYIYIFTYAFVFIFGYYSIQTKTDFFDPRLIHYLGIIFISFSLAVNGYKQPGLMLYENSGSAENKEKAHKHPQKYKHPILNPDEEENLKHLLLSIMKDEKPYLNPDLNTLDLAASINVSRHQLTQVLNNNINMNFYTFINSYRAEEAKRILTDSEYSHFSILAIAYEAGFNSKATFNKVFKNITGVTPTNYKKGTNS